VSLPKVLDNRTFDRRARLERAVAHVKVLSQRRAERVELTAPRFKLLELVGQQIADMTAPRASRVGLVADQIADLAQAQAMRLRLLDEPDAIDRSTVVFAKTSGCPAGPREQALSLVITKSVASQTAGRGELTDAHRSSIHERAIFA
jgi:hypothetical protein